MKKLMQMIKQAVITRTTNDSESYPRAQATYSEKPTEIVRHSPYGLCSNPPVGSLGILFEIQGRESVKYGVFDNVTRRFKNLLPGEVQVGNYDKLTSIKFDNNGTITITATADVVVNATNVTVNATQTIVNGDVIIDGDLDVTGEVTATEYIAGTINLTTHIHDGVESGIDNSGPPVS